MAEVILPPIETEPEIPEEQLPEVEKPTEQSKVISVDFNPLNTKQTASLDTRESFFTTDTDAWIVLNVGDMNEPTGQYSLALINKEDGSIFQRTGDIIQGVAYYKLLPNEIKHAGRWVGQAVITLANGQTTASRFSFNVSGHILDGKDVREIVIQDFQTLMAQLNDLKDNATNEFSFLKNEIEAFQTTIQENEDERQAIELERVAAEIIREETYDSKVDSAIVEADVVEKVDNKVAELSPAIQEVTAQLAQTEQVLNERVSQTIATAGEGKVPSELTDMRVKADGGVATTAGDSLRETQTGEAIVDNAIKSNHMYSSLVIDEVDFSNYGMSAFDTKLFLKTNPIPKAGRISVEFKSTTSKNGKVVLYTKKDNVIMVIDTMDIYSKEGFNYIETDIIAEGTGNEFVGLSGINFAFRQDITKVFGHYESVGDINNISDVKEGATFSLADKSVTGDIQLGFNVILSDFAISKKISELRTLILPPKQEDTYRDKVTFTIPVNQHVVDNNSTSIEVVDNEETFEDVPGVLFLPENYSQQEHKVPLVMMAHGYGEYVSTDGKWGSNPTWIGWKDALVDNGYAVFDINGYGSEINPDSKHWGSPRAIEAYFKAYQFIISNYNVDELIYITGGSMGGMTALNFANAHSNIARCVLAYAPCTDFINQISSTAWREEYKKSYGIEETYNVAGWSPIDMHHLGVPLKIWHGTGDGVLNYQYSKNLVDNLKENNLPAELRLLEGEGHDVAYGNQTVIKESLMYMNRYK